MLDSIQEILDRCRAEDVPFWRVVRASDMEQRQVTAEASREKMRQTWLAMLESEESYQARRRSLSGLAGGDGGKMRDFAAQGHSLSGDYLSEVIAAALCVGEGNACMRKIVAAPTAGACGVLPAVLIPLYRKGKASEEKILQALYVAAGIGAVISCRACIAGAAGGCQAEIGSASAMAAGALVALRGTVFRLPPWRQRPASAAGPPGRRGWRRDRPGRSPAAPRGCGCPRPPCSR